MPDKSLSFADAYGLGLIAKDPGQDWKTIVDNLSDDARQIANAIISGASANRDAKNTANDLLTLAQQLQKSRA